jgi:hypothetical protein
LIHGTFVGSDAMGLVRDVARVWPEAGKWLGQLEKQLADHVAGDNGNFTASLAEQLQRLLADSGAPEIEVTRYSWSGENHHIGRADAAVRLIEELNDCAARLEAKPSSEAAHTTPPPRILTLGHSHGGNVLSLVTNLLGADTETREQFFAAAKPYYKWPLAGHVDLPHWPRVLEHLSAHDLAIARVPLDIVTLGTPVRYGWETRGYGKLLHLVHHRARDEFRPHFATFPFTWEDLAEARGGDVLQQLGVAGTNFSPGPLNLRAVWADQRLNRMLQPGLRRRDLLARWKIGLRVHDEGDTLLIDYPLPKTNFWKHLGGHAVYTQTEWLLYHAEIIAEHLYAQAGVHA